MNYSQLLGQGNLGAPPAPVRTMGAPPPAAQPHVAPPPYDAATDPAWRGILDPNDHAFRNTLNEMDPETRQMLLQKMMAARAGSMLNAAPHMPPQPAPGPPGAAQVLPPR
jgi:hypothetical protein